MLHDEPSRTTLTRDGRSPNNVPALVGWTQPEAQRLGGAGKGERVKKRSAAILLPWSLISPRPSASARLAPCHITPGTAAASAPMSSSPMVDARAGELQPAIDQTGVEVMLAEPDFVAGVEAFAGIDVGLGDPLTHRRLG